LIKPNSKWKQREAGRMNGAMRLRGLVGPDSWFLGALRDRVP
jgi:hypothetical protein